MSINPNHANRSHATHQPSRRGLAPLELVLWLPVLLFVAALMVNLGTMTAWRMRGEIVSRDAAWRARWPRTGENEPRPKKRIWPENAQMDVAEDRPIGQGQGQGPDLSVFGQDMRLLIPWPQRELLDWDEGGAYRGTAEIDRAYPTLSKLGRFESCEIANPMLDRVWQSPLMHLESTTGRRLSMPNVYRRIKALFTEPELTVDFASLKNAADSVRPLDNPDFHPRVNSGRCELDVELVRRMEVIRLIGGLDAQGNLRQGEISRVPGRMESYYRQLQEQNMQP